MSYKELQSSLAALAAAQYKKQGTPITERVLSAFLKTPRHEFVEKIRNFGDDHWQYYSSENARELLPIIYQDAPLIIWGSEKEFAAKQGSAQVSTISQPSFVLRMLDLLDIQNGHKVFELGAASGWNAALIADLVGSQGQVVTVEIIPELAEKAAARLRERGLQNVEVLSGDGAFGQSGTSFDRLIFTAGAFDFPSAFFDQTKVGVLVLFVLKNKGGMDTLYLLERHEEYFESVYAEHCGFVSVTGSSHVREMEERDLNQFLSDHVIPLEPIEKNDFWWGSSNRGYFIGQTTVLRGYLSLFENYYAFDLGDGNKGFGWYDLSTNSLVVAKFGKLVAYGNSYAASDLKNRIKSWIDLGMPTLAVLKLRIYPASTAIENHDGAWISRRPQSTFTWRL